MDDREIKDFECNCGVITLIETHNPASHMQRQNGVLM